LTAFPYVIGSRYRGGGVGGFATEDAK